MQSHVEFSKDGRELVTWFHVLSNHLLGLLLVVYLYLSALVLGSRTSEYFMQAVAPRFLSYIVGGIATLVSSACALFIALFIPNRTEFLESVFHLYRFDDFRMAVTMAMLFVPISRVVSRLINRLFTSYASRKTIVIILCVVTISMLFMLNDSMTVQENRSAYAFSFVVVGIIYLILHRNKKSNIRIMNHEHFRYVLY